MAAARTPATAASFVCTACRHRVRASTRRTFTTSQAVRDDEQDSFARLVLASSTPKSPSNKAAAQSSPVIDAEKGPEDAQDTFARRGEARSTSRPGQVTSSAVLDALNQAPDATSVWASAASDNLRASSVVSGPHRLHIYATKHNTHITLVQPPRSAALTISSAISSTTSSSAARNKVVDVLLSMSTGNIGFRKGGRGTYDAGYQLGAFVMKQIQEKGMLRDIKRLEVVLRGFGAGREAVTKILLGTEGRLLRNRISAVMDATRLKIGGERSPNPRRLG